MFNDVKDQEKCVQPVKEAKNLNSLKILKEKDWNNNSLIINCQGMKNAGHFCILIRFLFNKTFFLFVITQVLEMKTLWTYSHSWKTNNKENPE